MNVNDLITTALSSLNLPVTADVNKTGATEYITFSYEDERPTVSGNDTDIIDTTIIGVHYFVKGDPSVKKKSIRRLLRAAGFTVGSTTQFYEDDTDYTHVIINAEIDGFIND